MTKGDMANQKVKAPRKTTITLALDSEVLKTIKQDAETEGSSINSKINSVLLKYACFYKYTEMLESVIIPYNQFVKMLDLMDEASLGDILSTHGNSHVISGLKHNRLPVTLETLIEYVFKTGARYSGAYKSFHHFVGPDGNVQLVFDHKFGPKWSRALGTALTKLIETWLQYRVESELLPYTITLRVIDRRT